MSIAENIKRIRERYNLTQDELGEIAGVSGGAVSTWERGTAEPRMGAVQRISDHLGISKSDIVDDVDSNVEPIKLSSSITIPVYGRVPAGVPIEAIESIDEYIDVPAEYAKGGKKLFGLKVKGDSMYPKYLDGDIIVVREESDCESGQDCVVYVNGYDATLKKVIKKADHIILQPLNPEYEPMMYEYNDEEHPVSIAGVVVEIRRKV